jgi:polyhydroxyalkanoate synthase
MTGPRLGPRPLPLHLWAAGATWLGSLLASPARATEAEAVRARYAAFIDGIEAYWAHPYRRRQPAPRVLWRAGTATLADHRADGGHGARPVLLVPSLVNRAYILDLAPGRSLVAYLAARGLAPLVVDWDEPGPEEMAFTVADYVTRRLEPALEEAAAGGPVPVVGYCMGGLLALALAVRRPRLVASLALLATPWDFHAEAAGWSAVLAALEPAFAAIVADGVLPVDVLQACFAAVQPMRVAEKFGAFAALDPASAQAVSFVQVEDWLNDGVPLAGPLASECLFGWYGRNEPARGAWRIDGHAVRPQEVACPALVFVPERDRIVPAASAAALGRAIPGARVRRVSAGHIGMMVGRRAQSACWGPLADWLAAPGN